MSINLSATSPFTVLDLLRRRTVNICQAMASAQLAASPLTTARRNVPLLEGLRPSKSNLSVGYVGCHTKQFRGFVVNAATTVASSKYTSIKPLGDRVLIKTKIAEEKSSGGILLPTTAQNKPQSGDVIAVGAGKKIGNDRVPVSLKTGSSVLYSKYSGTEIELDGSSHLLLKEDDVIGVLETDDVKELKPLNDVVLIKVAEVEEKTAGGLLLTDAAREKPSIGTVIAVGPGRLDEEGNRTEIPVSAGQTVLYSKYAGNDLKGSDGSNYIALRASELMAVLS